MPNEQADLEAKIIYDVNIGTKEHPIRDITIGVYGGRAGIIHLEIEEKKVLLKGKIENRKACYVKEISINPEYKNRGVRVMMLNEMEKVAKQEKCDRFQRKAGPYTRSFEIFPELIEDLNKPFQL
jgi:GNAT superfamily N-acetyltransferase